jgi:hypothetical protein
VVVAAAVVVMVAVVIAVVPRVEMWFLFVEGPGE